MKQILAFTHPEFPAVEAATEEDCIKGFSSMSGQLHSAVKQGDQWLSSGISHMERTPRTHFTLGYPSLQLLLLWFLVKNLNEDFQEALLAVSVETYHQAKEEE